MKKELENLAWVIVAPEIYRAGWYGYEGGLVVHHPYTIVRREGENYIVIAPGKE